MADSRLSVPSPGLFVPSPPRWCSQRSSLPTRGSLDGQVAGTLGWSMFTWQQDAADLAGEYDPSSGRPRFRTVGIAVARQNGKTTLVLARIARQTLPKSQTIAYTAQDRSLARMKWMEHCELLMDTPFAQRVERWDKQQNREMLVMKNGSRYLPVTPTTKKAGRSLSIDLAIIDEAYSHDSMGVIDALKPTMIARPLAQLWLLSNAGDEHSELWWYYTELGRRAVEDPDSQTCWIEYAPVDEFAKVDVMSEANWRAANPSMGEPGGVDQIALAAAAKEDDRRTFCKEHLNIWVDKAAAGGLDQVRWHHCFRPDLEPGRKVAFGLDYDSDRSTAALVSAGIVETPEGKKVTPVEVIDVSEDFDALVQRAAANANEFDGLIVVQATSPAGSAIPTLERLTEYGRARNGKRPNRVKVVSTTETAKAVGSLYDAVADRRLSHKADPRLDAEVQTTGRRRVGDVFVWDHHGVLSAATLARWGVLTAPEPKKRAQGRVAAPKRQPGAGGRPLHRVQGPPAVRPRPIASRR